MAEDSAQVWVKSKPAAVSRSIVKTADPNVCTVTIPVARFKLVPDGARLLAVLMDLDDADADRLVNGG